MTPTHSPPTQPHPPQDDPNAVTRAVDFTGSFPELGPPQVYSDRVDHRFTQALHAAKMIMAGAWDAARRDTPLPLACACMDLAVGVCGRVNPKHARSFSLTGAAPPCLMTNP